MNKSIIKILLMGLGLGMATAVVAQSAPVEQMADEVVTTYRQTPCRDIKKGVKPQDNDAIVQYLIDNPHDGDKYVQRMAPKVYTRLQTCKIN